MRVGVRTSYKNCVSSPSAIHADDRVAFPTLGSRTNRTAYLMKRRWHVRRFRILVAKACAFARIAIGAIKSATKAAIGRILIAQLPSVGFAPSPPGNRHRLRLQAASPAPDRYAEGAAPLLEA